MLFSGLCYGQAKFELTTHWNTDRSDNFFLYGELTQLDERRFPVGWDDVSAFESGNAVTLDNPKGVIQLTCPDDGSETSVSTTIELPKRIKFVTILTRMRGPTIDLGESDRAGAGMIFTLEMKDGKQRAFPRVEPYYKYGSLGGWKTYRSTMRVLPGYTKLNIRAVVEDAKGSFELDRILVLPSTPSDQVTAEQIQQLRLAIRSDDGPAVTKLIEATPELLEIRDGSMENGTPLICAAWYNSKIVAKELVRLGANLEASDESWENTPLAWCCWWGNAEVAEILIDAGAKTKHYANMAASSKTNNRSPRGKPEDFDRIVERIHAAQQEPQK
jgi:hypothetical protein